MESTNENFLQIKYGESVWSVIHVPEQVSTRTGVQYFWQQMAAEFAADKTSSLPLIIIKSTVN